MCVCVCRCVGVVWVGVQCLGDMYVCLGECMCIVHVCASPILLTALSWCVCTCVTNAFGTNTCERVCSEYTMIFNICMYVCTHTHVA